MIHVHVYIFQFHHRDPHLIGMLSSNQIPQDRTLYFGLIADGIHTHPAALRIAYRVHQKGRVEGNGFAQDVVLHTFMILLQKLLYPLQNGVLGGYTVFSMSVIPSFHQHLRVLLCNFDSFLRFCSNLHYTLTIRECMFSRKIGAEGSVLQELCPL